MILSLLNTTALLVFKRTSFTMPRGRTLLNVVSELEKFAPLNLAEKWDNVGLLIEPPKERSIRKILLTNDLTERVMKEAVEQATDLIVSYHPPIFAPLKRITQKNWKERIVSICLAEGIALYSPHTAWDAVPGGVNDWLSSALPCIDMQPIQPNPLGAEFGGAGRTFTTSLTLGQAVARVQRHIGLNVHLALGVNHDLDTPITVVAVCAGSGGSLLKGYEADLFITGEMSHHEVLDANHQNTSVILCNHSNSERGFLHKFQNKLDDMLKGDCEIIISEKDEDPLKTQVKS
ncbi:NIF3-like protein 1 isoform X1 [Rhagoletis pomonella]|uniref:NIF3-like protein 1 isoform X1 n=2 Tax=Rhagoletis pomonella TaxID=28610 RepID=UPI00178409CA|nr:NIF3-like protein 1 isoform X1 [Rhagoletis pomonella]